MLAYIYLHMIARYSYEYVHPTLHCVLKKGTLGQLRFINASKLNAFTRSLYRSTKSKLNFSTQDRVAITQAWWGWWEIHPALVRSLYFVPFFYNRYFSDLVKDKCQGILLDTEQLGRSASMTAILTQVTVAKVIVLPPAGDHVLPDPS
jgi:hypothetical protein